MRLTALLLTTTLLAATAITFVPAASAAPPCWYAPVDEKLNCLRQEVKEICVYGYSPDCLVYNPCNPTYCDPWWP